MVFLGQNGARAGTGQEGGRAVRGAMRNRVVLGTSYICTSMTYCTVGCSVNEWVHVNL